MRGRWVVRLPTWLGDTVMAVPTIRALARSVDALTLWGPEHHVRLLQATGVRADLLAWSRRPGARGVVDALRGATALAGVHAQGALLLPNALEPALIAAIARVRRRVGYATDGRGRLLTDPVPAPDPLEPVHDGERYAALLRPLNVAGPHPEDILLELPQQGLPRVAALLQTPRPLLGLVPGCANGPAKRWPAAAYAELADRAAARWDALPVILGGAADRAAADELEAVCTAQCVNLAGRTDVIELAAVLQSCRAVVSNDTGSAHLAAALSCPTLVLFGPTDPRRTRARGPHVRIASIGAFCQPCMAKACPLDHRCMEGLTTDLVVGALEPLWAATAGSLVS